MLKKNVELPIVTLYGEKVFDDIAKELKELRLNSNIHLMRSM